jgi:putative intracellular protease/amidase
MRVLFIISGADTAFWLSEVTHPYWHLTERDVEVDSLAPRAARLSTTRIAIPISPIPPRPTTWSARDFCRTRHLLRSWGKP